MSFIGAVNLSRGRYLDNDYFFSPTNDLNVSFKYYATEQSRK